MTEYDDEYDDEESDEEEEDDREVKVGARVQKSEDVAEPMGGVITAHEPAKRPREREYWKFTREEQEDMEDHWLITWDDGTTEREKYPQLEDNEMERQFRKTAHEALDKIHKKLAIASKALDEAEAIAEKYGIPFSSSISPLSQSYYPSTMHELHPDMDSEFINDITGAYHSDYGEEGWQHSAVC